jgi:hypothetical protein
MKDAGGKGAVDVCLIENSVKMLERSGAARGN